MITVFRDEYFSSRHRPNSNGSTGLSKLSLYALTGYGPVTLRLKVAWDIDQLLAGKWVEGQPPGWRYFNLCISHRVVIDRCPPLALGFRTADYFDGPRRTYFEDGSQFVLNCDPKWLYSATQFAKRSRPDRLDPIRKYMERRMRNAYSML